MNVADAIRNYMQKNGIGLQKIADQTGIPPEAVKEWLDGRSEPKEYLIPLIEFQLKYGGAGKVMPVPELVRKVAEICQKNGVEHLSLFGSFATGTATETSDIDFVVYGCKDIMELEEKLEVIDTLRKIDIFDHDQIRNEYLLEDIKDYGKQIY